MLHRSIIATLVLSLALHSVGAGAHVLRTATDHYTFWIDPVSTTLPLAFWAVVTVVAAHRRRGRDARALVAGYLAGWLAMTALGVWIGILPRGAEHSSTLGVAMLLTPFMFLPVFPPFFLLGRTLGRYFTVKR